MMLLKLLNATDGDDAVDATSAINATNGDDVVGAVVGAVGADAESYYIGTYGLCMANTGEILIYDWRAPVSSMFYDFEPGRALYECPSGYIEGELILKRQYRIESGRLILMFDSNVAIRDNILHDILALFAPGHSTGWAFIPWKGPEYWIK